MWTTSLIHQEYTFRHRSACRTPDKTGQEDHIQNHAKLGRMKELGGITGVL